MKRILLLCLLCLLCLPALLCRASLVHYTTRDGLPTPEVWQVLQLPNRQILVQSVGGFSVFNGRRFELLLCPPGHAWPLRQFGGYAHMRQGDTLLWLRDYYHVYLLDVRTAAFVPASASRMQQPSAKAFAASHYDKGVEQERALMQRAQSVLDSLLRAGGAPQVTTACRDHEGGLWMGTLADGVYYWHDTAPCVATCPMPGIRALARADARHLLLGDEHDLLLFDTRELRIVAKLQEGCGRCHDAWRDARGRVWASTDAGLFCYADGRISHHHPGNCRGLLHSRMRFARGPLPDGRMLVCNLQHYLGLLDVEHGVFTSLNRTFGQLEGHRLLTDAGAMNSRNDSFVLCSQNGLRRLSLAGAPRMQEGPAILPTEKFNCTCRDRKGRMWIGTQNGLLLQQGRDYRRFTQRDGLRNLCINSMVEDAAGHLWIGTAFGVEQLSLNEGDTLFVGYDTTSGMPEALMCERAATLMPDGKVWMASTEGLVCFSPAMFRQAAKAAAKRVLVLGMENDEGEVAAADGVFATTWRNNNLLVKCMTTDYATAGRTRYRYRLAGLENNWMVVHHAGGFLQMRYRALPPGTYRLQIQAACDTEAWGMLTEKVIRVLPPLWLTGWAKAAYALLALLLATLTARLYVRRVQRRIDRENEEKVHRLFELREEARHQFAQNLQVSVQNLSATSEDARLMEKLLQAIEQNMSNTDYTVDQLAADVALGRSNLYKRMQQMLGITPNDFLRGVRLKRAAMLLAETTLPVGEIARAVGFSSPRYFSQYFKKMFGMTPSAYAQRGDHEE